MKEEARERPSILIVEDEFVIAMDLQRTLVQLGYKVAGIAGTGDEALRLIADSAPDLVLMDVHLAGDRDGITVAEEIHRRWQVPIVFATAHANPETLARAKLTGALAYLTKPYRANELNATLVVALHQHRMAREWFAEHAWITMLLASLGEGVIGTDAEGRVRYVNPVAESLTGWTQAEAAGRPIEDVYPLSTEAGERVERCQLRSALARRASLDRHAFWLIDRSGRRIPIEDARRRSWTRVGRSPAPWRCSSTSQTGAAPRRNANGWLTN